MGMRKRTIVMGHRNVHAVSDRIGILQILMLSWDIIDDYSRFCACNILYYSHGTEDEFSGDEETVVDSSKLFVPSSPDSCIDISSELGSGKHSAGKLIMLFFEME